MNRSWFLLLFLIAACFKGFGQKTLSYDTNYVKENYDKLCITLLAENPNYELTVGNAEDDNKDLTYSTNSPTSFGFGLDYKWLTFSYAYAFKSMNKTDIEGGFTKVNAFSVGITSNRFWSRAFYQTQSGMYLTNANVFPQHKEINTIRPDISGNALFGCFNYIFNHRRYSHNATLWQIDQQYKSAGTFTVGCALAQYTTKADSALIPFALRGEFTVNDDIKRSRTTSYAITGGYMHTFVIAKRIFIHLGVIPGVCLQKTISTMNTGVELRSDYTWGGYTEGRFVLGYNGKKYYGGVSGTSYLFTENSFDEALEHSYNFTRLFFGMRLPLKLKVPLEKYF